MAEKFVVHVDELDVDSFATRPVRGRPVRVSMCGASSPSRGAAHQGLQDIVGYIKGSHLTN
jgi:hypothetical protein